MKIWLDAHLPPQLAPWASHTLGVEAHAVRDLGLRDAEDEAIFQAARRDGAVVITKDADFLALLDRFGPPPQVIWLTCGSSGNSQLRKFWLALCRRPCG